ncbi:MAG: hypothetical protein RLZZ540_2056 [Bacteroidota bacterium]|jgi:hypothetical protein
MCSFWNKENRINKIEKTAGEIQQFFYAKLRRIEIIPHGYNVSFKVNIENFYILKCLNLKGL